MRNQSTTEMLDVYTSDEDNPYLAAMPELLKKMTSFCESKVCLFFPLTSRN